MMRRLVYPQAGAVVVHTDAARALYPRSVRRKIAVIPNPLAPDVLRKPPKEGGGGPEKTVAAMGRLVPQKRFDLLIRAFARVAGKHRCSLTIAGDGPLKEELRALAAGLGVADKVCFPGVIPNPWAVLGDSDIFVLSSEHESWGNVLAEAMAVGPAVISFDCSFGPRELIRDGIDGVLVPPLDVDALAAALDRLLGDDEERIRLGRRAVEVRERFSVEKIMPMWEEVIEKVCGHA